MVGAGILVALGAIGYASAPVSSAIWMVAAGGFALFLAVALLTVTPLLLKIESTLARQLGVLRDVHDALLQQASRLDEIVENTRISDAAKSVAHREQELDALRAAIREDIRNERWEAAFPLTDALEHRFGFKKEAARLRSEVQDAYDDAIQVKLAQAVEMIEGFQRAQEWDRAEHEIERLRHILPDASKVTALVERMDALKAQRKEELMAAWHDAVHRNDTDHAIEVLRELDQYLTSEEGRSLEATARSVFKEKLLQLGVQFRFAVKDKRWSDALNTGLELVRDFPNALMATEVRENLDRLRERARQAADHPAAESVRGR